MWTNGAGIQIVVLFFLVYIRFILNAIDKRKVTGQSGQKNAFHIFWHNFSHQTNVR